MKKVQKITPVTKVGRRAGYVHKPITSVIVLCACGGKYVSTRLEQTMCVSCIQKESRNF